MPALLMENGSYLLLEGGSHLLLGADASPLLDSLGIGSGRWILAGESDAALRNILG